MVAHDVDALSALDFEVIGVGRGSAQFMRFAGHGGDLRGLRPRAGSSSAGV